MVWLRMLGTSLPRVWWTRLSPEVRVALVSMACAAALVAALLLLPLAFGINLPKLVDELGTHEHVEAGAQPVPGGQQAPN